jgi:tRNA (guanine37-N1)-methyltransferase
MSTVGVPYREMLLREFGREGYKSLTKSFDVLGNIAVIDAEGSAARKIARIVMETHKNVKTVLRKGGAVEGRHRVRKYIFVRGRRDYIAHYNENGSSFMFDVRKVFFSPRLAYERKRIVDLVLDGEKIVVMFAGVGPFAIEIAKKNRKSDVVAIEVNRHAYRYMARNIELNKTMNVKPVLGSVEAASRDYRGFAERIIMPLPGESYKYLDAAFRMAGRRCIVHYYVFADDNGDDEIERLERFAKKKGFQFVLLGRRTARPYSSLISEIALDFEIRKR